MSHESWDNVPSLNKQETSKMVRDKYWISETKGEYWNVMFGDEYVMSCRAKSRSKVEMKYLLDHFNAKLTQAKLDLKRERHNAKLDLKHALEKRLEE